MWSSSSRHWSNPFIATNKLTSSQKHPACRKYLRGGDVVSGTLVTFSLGVLWEGMGKALWAGVGHRGRYQSVRDVLIYLSSQDGWTKP